jgi:hypothetical protein
MIPNPNSTLLLVERWPELKVRYILRKKKHKEYEMCFCTKVMVEIEVDGRRHVIKVERKGPSSGKVETEVRNGFAVIDYDGMFQGNSTICQVFQF